MKDGGEDEGDAQTAIQLIQALNWRGLTLLAIESLDHVLKHLQLAHSSLFNKEDLPIRMISVVQVLWASIQKLKAPTSSGMSNLPIYNTHSHCV
jgi:hypothetical protein